MSFTLILLLIFCALQATHQYDVNITYSKLDLNFFNFTQLREFEANATIKFRFNSKIIPEYVYLYASEETIDIQSVLFNDYDLFEKHVEFLNKSVLRVFVPRALEISNSFKLVVKYKGLISEGEECGVFMRKYQDGRYFVSSNFEGECARRVLPVFQEYGMRSTYEISVVISVEYFAVSSTEDRMNVDEKNGLRKITFQTTPKIAPSSLQIIVGEFECNSRSFNEPLMICTFFKLNGTETFAADTLMELMYQLENRTGVEYKNFSSKMYMVVFPVLGVEPTSALGVIAAGPENLLWQTDLSTDRDKQRIATFLAKKVAEQWFNHLVSPKTYQRRVLNQGFAEHLAYKALNEMFPEQYFDEQFMVEVYQSSLEVDSGHKDFGHQIFGINNAKISRGSCLIKMAENILGSDVFDNATKQFLSKYNLSNIEPEDFWSLIDETFIANPEELPANVSIIMENWTKSTRYPLLEVQEGRDSLSVTQKQFGDVGTLTDMSWYVPIALTNEDREYWEVMWSTPEAPTVEHEGNVQGGVLLNKNAGYYRVDYDQATWSTLQLILRESGFGGLTDVERSFLIDDMFNMAEQGRMKYEQVGDILSFLREDTSYFSWYAGLKGFRRLLDRSGEDTELGRMISQEILDLLEISYKSLTNTTLPTQHNHIDSLNKEQILYWSCRLGKSDCIQDLRVMFDRYKTNYITINADIKKMVFCSVLRYSKDLTDLEFMWNEFDNSSELLLSKFFLLPIVGCLKDQRMLEMGLNYVLKETNRFTSHDFTVVFTSIYEESPEGIQAALKFFSQNAMAIHERLGNSNLFQKIFTGLANKLTTVQQLRTLKHISLDVEDFEKILMEASNVVQNNIAWLKTYRSDLESHFIYGNGAVIKAQLWATILFVCFLLISYCVYNTTSILYLFSPGTYREQAVMMEELN